MKLKRNRIASSLLFLPLLPVTSCGTGTAFRMPDPNVRYVAFGESTTAGPSERDYPDILREKLDQPPETFSNEGLGGESTEEGLERLADLIDRGLFPNARSRMLNLKPILLATLISSQSSTGIWCFGLPP